MIQEKNFNLVNRDIRNIQDYKDFALYGYSFMIDKYGDIIRSLNSKEIIQVVMNEMIQDIRELLFNIQIINILNPKYVILIKHYYDKFYQNMESKSNVEQAIFAAFGKMFDSLGKDNFVGYRESIKLLLENEINRKYPEKYIQIQDNLVFLNVQVEQIMDSFLQLPNEEIDMLENLVDFYQGLFIHVIEIAFEKPNEKPVFSEFSFKDDVTLNGNISNNKAKIMTLLVAKYNEEKYETNISALLNDLYEITHPPSQDLIDINQIMDYQPTPQPTPQSTQNYQPTPQSPIKQPPIKQPPIKQPPNKQPPNKQPPNPPQLNLTIANTEFLEDDNGGTISYRKNLQYDYVSNMTFYFPESVLRGGGQKETMETGEEGLFVVYKNVVPLISGKYIKKFNSACTMNCMNTKSNTNRNGIHVMHFVYMRTQGMDNNRLEEIAQRYIVETSNRAFAPSIERKDGVYGSIEFTIPVSNSSYNVTKKMNNKSSFNLLNTESLSIVIICVKNDIGGGSSNNNVIQENNTLDYLIEFTFGNFINTTK